MEMIAVALAISICFVVGIKVLTHDEINDIEINVGKFHFSIKRHD